MKILNREQFLEKEDFYAGEIEKGKLFIYPTDTIYGIGCIATNSASIKKIRKIKNQDQRPFSIIIPGKSWSLENCEINNKNVKELEKLPGPYTLIVKLKNKKIISSETNQNRETIGIRIPDNWFSEFLQQHNFTFITTSVNFSGQPHLVKISDLNRKIASQVDYIIDDGPLTGKPSIILDLTKDKINVLRF